jgi:gamma-glutamyltranspeptidase/glutathione hydrolase
MPAAATLEKYAELGLKHPEQSMPGHGMLAACVPGAFDAWMLLLATEGTMRPGQVLKPFITYCNEGVPVSGDTHNTLGRKAKFLFEHWPTSAECYLDAEGNPPPMDGLWKNPMMGATFQRLVAEAEVEAAGGGSADGSEARRQAEIAAIRKVWSTGFVAHAIAAHCATEFMNDRTNAMERGLITLDDMASYSARVEPALTYEYKGWTVGKAGPWSQGPVFLQMLALLKGFPELEKHAPDSPEFIHLLVEATKLAFADRTAYYGDPDHHDVPIATLLSDEYNDSRRKLIDPKRAAAGLVPGIATGAKIDGAGGARRGRCLRP